VAASSVGARRRVADVPLFWKLLAPSIALTLVLAVVGTFAVVRYLSNEAQSNLDDDLRRTAVGAQVALTDETDYLVETARVNTHVQGVQDALSKGRVDDLAELLAGAAAVRDHADLFVFTDASGAGVVELRRSGDGLTRTSGTAWGTLPAVQRVLRADVHDVGDETAGFFLDGSTQMLLVAAPVIDNAHPLGAAVVGTDMSHLAERAARQIGAQVALYGPDRNLLASNVAGAPARAPSPKARETIRQNARVGAERATTLFAPMTLRGGQTGFIAVSLPRKAAGIAGVGARVGGVFLAAILIVLSIGAAIVRGVLGRMRNMLDANRSLAGGNLATRAPDGGRDELGELATGFNVMAEQLEASYRELERRVAERTAELQRLYDESVEATQARSEFFAAISHELRTPLFVIAGHAELMAHPDLQPTDEGWEQEYGQTIHQAALDLLARVNEILDLAKLETKSVSLDLADVAVSDAAQAVANELAPLARQAGLKLRVDVASDLPLVRADTTRLRDVLRNLVANAIKYTPGGGSVVISAAQKSKRLLEISVSDTGIGIPPEAHEHLFEPFYQVPGHEQDRQRSTGLGLALAERLVSAHGGTMRVRSRVGEGSTFTFTMPVAATKPARRQRAKVSS
jgi:signal transduction histidine kinase